MINVCFVLEGFYKNGGIGRVTSIIANKLSERPNYSIHCLCRYDNGKSFLYSLNSNIKISYWLDENLNITKSILKNKIKSIRAYLLENEIDIAIGCGSMFTTPLLLSSRGLKTKIIFWDHTSPYINSEVRFEKYIRVYNCKRSDVNVLLTKAGKSFYDKKTIPGKNLVFNNPVDDKAVSELPYNVESKKIISVGRLSMQKNFACLVDVASRVLPKYPDWQWDIYGEGELKEVIEQKIDEYHLNQQLHLMGQVSDLYNRYNDYSFLVLTSAWEGFPMTLLEACANNLPMISFDIHTGPNEIINGSNGYLVEFEDRDQMARRINELLDNAILRKSMSEESRKCKIKYSLTYILGKWVDLLEGIYGE